MRSSQRSLIPCLASCQAEVVEYASGIGRDLMGEYVEHVSSGIDTFSIRQPLGVTAGICPFNFPGRWSGGLSVQWRLCGRRGMWVPEWAPAAFPGRCWF